MCLELGDNSIRYPLGIAEDVPVKVGHHFIPVDFVVLEMGEREKPPLILGRPFLKTVGATIDVGKGEIIFDINGERSSFKFQPGLEVCNMIKVKNVPPHCGVVKASFISIGLIPTGIDKCNTKIMIKTKIDLDLFWVKN
jgi:hypothetical protein